MKKIFSIQILEYIYISIGLSIMLFIFYCISSSPEKLVYDEPYFVHNLSILLEKGLSEKSIFFYEGQAPGPLFQLVYYFIFKITGIKFSIIYVRVFNFLFFNLGTLFFLSTFESYRSRSFWLIYFSIFSIPFLYPLFGLGLTECSSMFFVSLAMYSLLKGNKSFYNILIYTMALALALLGRQTFLAVVPVFFIYILISENTSQNKIYFSLSTLLALLPIL